MKAKRVPVPTAWNTKKWYYAVNETLAMRIAAQSKATRFDKFHSEMVNAFGACEPDCAAFLWNKLRPDKQRKYLFEYPSQC